MRMRTLQPGLLVVAILAAIVAACGDASDPMRLGGRRSIDGTDPAADGTAATDGNGGGLGPASSGGTPVPPGAGVPCDVAAMLAAKCLACHSDPPAPGALAPLVTVQHLLATAKEDPTKTEAQLSLARMQNAANPMPPASYGNAPTAADIAALQKWIDGGYQGSCGDAGAVVAAGPLSCTSCHGDANRAAVAGADPNFESAPPRGSKGETATTTLAVGAHQAHVGRANLMANPIACTECHVVPTTNTHSNGTADVTFGALAKTGNKTPVWSAAAGSCAATYCHGNFTGGSTTAAPSWTGGAMSCTSCHAAPPATGDHLRGDHRVACSTCHGTGYSVNGTTGTVNKALHMNGQKNAGGAGSGITYDAATRACTPTCHGTETW